MEFIYMGYRNALYRRGLVILGVFYCLRRGEVVGLKWGAIDFEALTMRIHRYHGLFTERTNADDEVRNP